MADQDKTNSALKIRPLSFEDGPGISSLSERNGLGKLDPSSWRAIWQDYPFAPDFKDVPAGWVIVRSEDEVLGYLGNVHQMYELNGVRLKAAIATGWVMDAEHRGKSLQLVLAFYKQKGVELYINGSANAAATKILTGLKIPRIPVPDYATPCFWAVRPRAFAQAVLRRKGIPGPALLSLLAGPVVWMRDTALRIGRSQRTVPVERRKSFDRSFDDLWQRISSATPRLRAIRTAAVLEWRFGGELRAGRAILLVAGAGDSLSGYAVLQRRDGSELGMELFDVADIQAVNDDPEVFTSLLLTSLEVTRQEGADALKLLTGTPAKRRPAEALRPYTYQLPFWQLYCKKAESVSAPLSSADEWDFSLFDVY